MDRILWRQKAHWDKQWHEGYVIERKGRWIKISQHRGAFYGSWYEANDLQIEEIK